MALFKNGFDANRNTNGRPPSVIPKFVNKMFKRHEDDHEIIHGIFIDGCKAKNERYVLAWWAWYAKLLLLYASNGKDIADSDLEKNMEFFKSMPIETLRKSREIIMKEIEQAIAEKTANELDIA